MRIMWAGVNCLHDTSSGASKSILTLLNKLALNGNKIDIVGATIFDSEQGRGILQNYSSLIERKKTDTGYIAIEDEFHKHYLTITGSPHRSQMTLSESDKWFRLMENRIRVFRPDFVLFFGGSVVEKAISSCARAHGVPSVAYIVNENYHGSTWCQDTDLLITDTAATAQYYKQRYNYEIKPIGKFVDTSGFAPAPFSKKDIDFLFINPRPEKGVFIIAQLAHHLKKYGKFIHVVNSRGSWSQFKAAIPENYEVDNIVELTHAAHLGSLMQRTKILLLPSLWRESGSRLIIEAGHAKVPVAYSDVGGNKELAGESSLKVKLPDEVHEKPFFKLAPGYLIEAWAERLMAVCDDKKAYLKESNRINEHAKRYNSQSSLEKFEKVIETIAVSKAGNRSFIRNYKTHHKMKLCDVFPAAEEAVERRILVDNFNVPNGSLISAKHDALGLIWKYKNKKILLLEEGSEVPNLCGVCIDEKHGWSLYELV